MWHTNEQKFILHLMPIAMLCLNSCAPENCEISSVAAYPTAGPKVAAELEKLSFEEYKNTWEWIARINKLRQELEVLDNKK